MKVKGILVFIILVLALAILGSTGIPEKTEVIPVEEVVIEDELVLEDWMTKPFELKSE